jgi:hypothetical protein
LYRESWEESLTLPRSLRDAFLEDALVDLLATGLKDNPVSSIQDARKYVESHVNTLIEVSTALVVSGALNRIATKLLIFSLGKPAPQEGALSKLVKATKLNERSSTALVHLYSVEAEIKIYFVVPDLQSGDTLSKRSLELLLTLAHYCLGVPVNSMYLVVDKGLGTEFRMDSSIIKLLEDLSSSAASPSGAYAGNVFKTGDYQCNLPTILASIHLLTLKSSYLRKRSPRKGEKLSFVSSSELRNLFNTRSGLNDKSSAYTTTVVKQLLQVITSVQNKRFPGGWIRSNRLMNNVKTDIGLVYKLGYTEKLPYNHKLQSVIFNDIVTGPDGRKKVRSKFDEKSFKALSFIEFRLGTVLTSPRLDTASNDSFDKQIKFEPMTTKSSGSLEAFNDSKYHKAIDTLNRAHALLVTIPKSTSKTNATHYEIARNELLHLSDKVPIKDYKGSTYSNLSDLPKPVYDYCCRLYRFNKSKRNVESMDIDSSVGRITENSIPQSKKPRVSEASRSKGAVLPLTDHGTPAKKGLRKKT